MPKILYFTTIPSPYRVDFFNALATHCELEVIFEAQRDPSCRFNLYRDDQLRFGHRFLSKCKDFRSFIFRGLWIGLTARRDHLVIHTYHTRTQTCLLLLLKLLGRRYWFETDGGMINQGEGRMRRWLKRLLISGAEGYFSPSLMSDRYLQYYSAAAERIHRYSFTSVSASDVATEAALPANRQAARHELGIDPMTPMLLAVGQFIPRKGFDILLQAMRHVMDDAEAKHADAPRPCLYIVGGEPTQEYLQQRTQLNLDGAVHFMGFKSKEALAVYYRAADLFVLPTREDIWGLVINEAMAYGLPVITTERCNAGLEMLDHQEVTIVGAGDAKCLSGSILQLLGNTALRQEIGHRNLAYSQQHCIEQMAREHAEHLV